MKALSKERLEEKRVAAVALLQHQHEIVRRHAEESLAMIDTLLAAYEPVAWIVHAHGGDQLTFDGNYVANAEGIHGIHSTPLHANAAPSIPTVSFYSDGIKASAAWVDAQREAYDNEHGSRDPDTGAFEFANDAQLDHSNFLAEIAEGIRALHPYVVKGE